MDSSEYEFPEEGMNFYGSAFANDSNDEQNTTDTHEAESRVPRSCRGQCARKKGRGACPCKATNLTCFPLCKCEKSKCKNDDLAPQTEREKGDEAVVADSATGFEGSFDQSAKHVLKTKLVMYANASYGGKVKDFSGSCDDLKEYLSNGAKSIMVKEDSDPWQVFTKVQFEGNSEVLYPGSYEKLKEIGLKSPVKSFRKAPERLALNLFETHAFGGNKKAFSASCDDLTIHLPEGASSVVVNEHSPADWQVFTEAQFRGAQVTLKPGKHYENLEKMGLNIPVKSFRKAPPGPGRGFRVKLM